MHTNMFLNDIGDYLHLGAFWRVVVPYSILSHSSQRTWLRNSVHGGQPERYVIGTFLYWLYHTSTYWFIQTSSFTVEFHLLKFVALFVIIIPLRATQLLCLLACVLVWVSRPLQWSRLQNEGNNYTYLLEL